MVGAPRYWARSVLLVIPSPLYELNQAVDEREHCDWNCCDEQANYDPLTNVGKVNAERRSDCAKDRSDGNVTCGGQYVAV